MMEGRQRLEFNFLCAEMFILPYVSSLNSLLNKDEASIVMDYIKELLLKKSDGTRVIKETDIGVVTPYRSQCQHIIDCCEAADLPDITVGTAEIFQGKEKPIIIVSTVRSGNGLGFVRDPKVCSCVLKTVFTNSHGTNSALKHFFQRFNVMVTRAKCLLIIVGNPHDLCADKNWSEMITYCVDNGALIQGDQEFTMAKKVPKK